MKQDPALIGGALARRRGEGLRPLGIEELFGIVIEARFPAGEGRSAGLDIGIDFAAGGVAVGGEARRVNAGISDLELGVGLVVEEGE